MIRKKIGNISQKISFKHTKKNTIDIFEKNAIWSFISKKEIILL